MAISIGDAVLKIGVDKKDFDRDMKGLRGAINKHKKAIGLAMVGMGVAALAGAAASVKAFAEMGDEVEKMALRTGFSTEALSELRHAAEISGASLGTLEKGVKRMSGTILDAKDGLETYIRSFRHIGIEVEELDGLNPEQQFLRIAEAIAEVEDPTKRAAVAQDIFGRAGTELLPLFAQGKEGLRELREEAHKLGIVFDQEAAESAAEFKDSLTRLDGALNGVKFTLAKELMPAMEASIPLLEKWVKWLGPIIENTLNWYAADDKRLKQQDAWRNMSQQRLRFLHGINNEYGKSIDLLESVLKNQGLLGAQQIETIAKLREEIEARQEVNIGLEEQNELLEEHQEEYEATTIEVDNLRGAYTALVEEMKIVTKEQLAMSRGFASTHEMWKTTLDYQREMARRYEAGQLRPELARQLGLAPYSPALAAAFAAGAFEPEEFQRGGIAMRPMVARIAEKAPEAVIPLDKFGGMLGGKSINIYVELDGRIIARAIGQPLVDEIRLKTGVHI